MTSTAARITKNLFHAMIYIDPTIYVLVNTYVFQVMMLSQLTMKKLANMKVRLNNFLIIYLVCVLSLYFILNRRYVNKLL